tara:strand:- start:260 stop:1081 length:822 start_codon:yes stop_codon:yes gene_type:complete
MGVDGSNGTNSYMISGETPTFKVYDKSEEEILDMNIYNFHPNSSDLSWSISGFINIDQLINVNYSFANAANFENTATVSSIFSDDIYEMGSNDILTAHSGDEIRGISIAVNNDISNGNIFFCSIFLDQTIQECKFKYYNYENKLIFDLHQSLSLNADDSFGSALSPYIFSIKSDELDISNNILRDDFSIIEAYPNPFNPIVNISLNIINPHLLDISVFDMNGNRLDRLFKGYKNYGEYEYQWDASSFPSGVYFAVIEDLDNRSVVSEKICLIK